MLSRQHALQNIALEHCVRTLFVCVRLLHDIIFQSILYDFDLHDLRMDDFNLHGGNIPDGEDIYGTKSLFVFYKI